MKTRWLPLAAAAILAIMTTSVSAEPPWERGRDRDDRWEDYDRWDDDDRWDDAYERHGGEDVPAFCRTGEGHPVFGREWCDDRGHYGYDRGPGLLDALDAIL